MAVRYTMSRKVTGPVMGAKVQQPVSGMTMDAKRLAPPAAARIPAPPAAPAGALAPSVTPPPDPAYDQTVAGLTRQRDTRLAALEAQRAQTFLTYGYKQDPVTGAISFDASNPYSQAAMYARQYDQARTGNTNSYAARGQLYAGSLQNAQNDAYFREGQAMDSTQKALQAALAANRADRDETLSGFELGLGDAMGGRIGRVGDNPLYSPVVPGAAAAASAAKAAATRRNPSSISAIAASVAAQKSPAAKPKVKVKAAAKGSGMTDSRSIMGPKRRR